MAKRIDNPAIENLHGKMGDLVFYLRKGVPCVRKAPVRTKKFTGPEKKNQSRFAQASKFASSVLSDPTQRARYEQAAQGTPATAQNLAVSDFTHSPTLSEIDLSGYTGAPGEAIRIKAEEGRLGAVAVKVVIGDSGKATLEQGAAVMEKDGFWWTYTSQKNLVPNEAVWITVTASDQAANKTSKSWRHSTGA
jgi:hypothetical protein